MEKVRTIIWDLDETVWFYKENETKVLCEKLNIDKFEEFRRQYYEMLDSIYTHFKDKIVTQDGMNRIIAKEVPILKLYGLSGEDLLKGIREEKVKFIELNFEAVQMMQYFCERGLKNISITDWFTKDQERTLENLNLRSYIQEIYGFDSRYLKSSKKRVKETAIEIIKDNAENFILIGDSLTTDIFFANSLGIKSIWYNRKGKVNRTGNVPTLEVKSLLELKEII